MGKRNFFQKVKRDPIEVHKDSANTEQSSYWDHVHNQDGRESITANPDILAELPPSTPSTPQLLMGEAVERLAGRQKECYLLHMREGKSLAEIAEILDMTKSSVQTYVQRAVRFICGYCTQAIKKGRV